MKAGDTIVVATKNTGKVREFAHALSKLGVNVVSMFDYPDVPDIIEDGETFMENARKKARTAAEALGLPALADDSGLPGRQLVERSESKEISAVYEQNRQDALAADVFGSPAMCSMARYSGDRTGSNYSPTR